MAFNVLGTTARKKSRSLTFAYLRLRRLRCLRRLHAGTCLLTAPRLRYNTSIVRVEIEYTFNVTNPMQILETSL